MKSSKKTDHVRVDSGKPYTKEQIQVMFPDLDLKVIESPRDKVVHLRCAGMDVHKKLLVTAAVITDPVTFIPSYYIYRTTQSQDNLEKVANWLNELGVKDICMESTGQYSIPVYRFFEDRNFSPVITHPKYVKAVRGYKTDEKDAIHIANLFRMGQVTPSVIPSREFQDFRSMSRSRKKLVNERTREKSRFLNILLSCGIFLANYLTDIFGITGMKIIDYLMSCKEGEAKESEIATLVSKRCKESPRDIWKSVKGFRISALNMVRLTETLAHINELNKHIEAYETQMRAFGLKYAEKLANIQTISGISELSALSIIAEIGVDMSLWNGCNQFISWCGLCPASNSSAGKNKSTKIGLGGHYLKPILVECALNAVKTDPYFKNKYERIAARRGKKKAIIAVARMMLKAIYYILRDDVCFLPKDYDKVMHQAKKKVSKDELHYMLDALRASGVDEAVLKMVMDQCAAHRQQETQKAKGQNSRKDNSEKSGNTQPAVKTTDKPQNDYNNAMAAGVTNRRVYSPRPRNARSAMATGKTAKLKKARAKRATAKRAAAV